MTTFTIRCRSFHIFYYTFNDGAINDCIRLMLQAHKAYGKEDYLASARRGGDFIILSQLPAPQGGWGQQYSHDMKPARARSFEPAGLSSASTSRNIRTLIELYLYTRDERYLGPIPGAIAWLRASTIRDGVWGRLYEVGTNRPIYGDRTAGNKVFYDYDKISERERTSYSWQGGYGIETAIRSYERIVSLGEAAFAETPDPTVQERAARARGMASRVRSTIDALDEQGRWVLNGWITCQAFTANMAILCEYLECAGETGEGH